MLHPVTVLNGFPLGKSLTSKLLKLTPVPHFSSVCLLFLLNLSVTGQHTSVLADYIDSQYGYRPYRKVTVKNCSGHDIDTFIFNGVAVSQLKKDSSQDYVNVYSIRYYAEGFIKGLKVDNRNFFTCWCYGICGRSDPKTIGYPCDLDTPVVVEILLEKSVYLQDHVQLSVRVEKCADRPPPVLIRRFPAR